MNRSGRLIILAFMMLFAACTGYRDRKAPAEGQCVIRYVNLKYLYDYMINNNKDALEIAQKKETAISTLKQMETQMKDPSAGTAELALNYSRQKQLYSLLEKQEDEFKRKMSQRIHRSLLDVAEQTGADFVLNIGDEVIYGKKKYDITEDVIREIISLGKRSEPVSR